MEKYINEQMQSLKEWWGNSLEESDYKNLEKFIRDIYLTGKNSSQLEPQVANSSIDQIVKEIDELSEKMYEEKIQEADKHTAVAKVKLIHQARGIKLFATELRNKLQENRMENYEQLILDNIKGDTPQQKYENLKIILSFTKEIINRINQLLLLNKEMLEEAPPDYKKMAESNALTALLHWVKGYDVSLVNSEGVKQEEKNEKIINFVKEKYKESWDKMGSTGSDDYWETATKDEIYEFGYFRAMEDVKDFFNQKG